MEVAVAATLLLLVAACGSGDSPDVRRDEGPEVATLAVAIQSGSSVEPARDLLPLEQEAAGAAVVGTGVLSEVRVAPTVIDSPGSGSELRIDNVFLVVEDVRLHVGEERYQGGDLLIVQPGEPQIPEEFANLASTPVAFFLEEVTVLEADGSVDAAILDESVGNSPDDLIAEPMHIAGFFALGQDGVAFPVLGSFQREATPEDLAYLAQLGFEATELSNSAPSASYRPPIDPSVSTTAPSAPDTVGESG